MIPPGVVLDARTVSGHFPGIGRAVLGLSGALAGIGAVTLLHGRAPDARLPIPPHAGISCAAGPFGIGQQWEVRRLLRLHGARLYHSPYYLMPYRPGVPSVVTCFDLIPLLVPGAMDRGKRLAYVLAHRMAFAAAAAVCVPSEATRRDVARLFPRAAARLVVVRPGVAPLTERALVRQPAGGRLPERFVLHVGSNKPHKGIDLLVRAWGTALEVSPRATADTALVLAGPRDARFPEPARSLARLPGPGRAVDLGPVPDEELAGLYARASLFVCPSRREGFGLPLAEAMLYGRACLCSDTPALAETAGGAAALFRNGDAASLCGEMVRLLSDPRETQRLERLAAARSAFFDWDTSARETSAVYSRVASQ